MNATSKAKFQTPDEVQARLHSIKRGLIADMGKVEAGHWQWRIGVATGLLMACGLDMEAANEEIEAWLGITI